MKLAEVEATDSLAPAPLAPRSGPAQVIARVGARAVQLLEPTSGERFVAQLAVPGYEAPEARDRVLFHTDDAGRRYVIGVLGVAPRRASVIDEVLASELEGVEALDEVTDESAARSAETREVRDERGRLLFEYDPEHERAVVHVPEGDLEIVVAQGGLTLSSRDGVVIHSERSIELGVARVEGASAKATLGPAGVTLAGAAVRLVGDKAELIAAHVGIRARRMETQVERLRQVVEVLDTRATRVVERAKDVFREVEGLAQHRAGTLRWVAEKTASIVAENALIKARDRVKIKGERIHLA